MFSMYLFILFFFAAPQVQEVSLEQLQANTIQNNDTLYVVNFWATWCKPCVAEMPYLEEAQKKFANNKVKVVFVSLNYTRELAVVDKFVKQKKSTSFIPILHP